MLIQCGERKKVCSVEKGKHRRVWGGGVLERIICRDGISTRSLSDVLLCTFESTAGFSSFPVIKQNFCPEINYRSPKYSIFS